MGNSINPTLKVKHPTYAMTAWRVPKVERLLNILENFDWDSLVAH